MLLVLLLGVISSLRVAQIAVYFQDCNRTLAEPLSEVKTVFLDLDGLKPQSGYPSLSPVSSVANSPQPSNGSYVLQVNSDINPREGSELAVRVCIHFARAIMADRWVIAVHYAGR